MHAPGDAAKRALDLVVAGAGALATAPLQAVIAVAVRRGSPGPALHRAKRVGRDGRPFEILKFRTMVVGAAAVGPAITARGDPRVTRVGRVLRATKLDELPQLWNVVRGDMSLVGPRPEDPRYVDLYTPDQRRVLSVRPGITGLATVEYRHEERVLAAAADPEEAYREVVMPAKLALDLRYVAEHTLGGDLRILARTVAAIVTRAS